MTTSFHNKKIFLCLCLFSPILVCVVVLIEEFFLFEFIFTFRDWKIDTPTSTIFFSWYDQRQYIVSGMMNQGITSGNIDLHKLTTLYKTTISF